MAVIGELRLTLRQLLQSWRYSTAVVLVFALAVGVNTAIFSAVYGVLLKPLPIHQPEHLVVLWDTAPARSLPIVELSYRTVEHWSRSSRSFMSVAALGSSTWPAILRGRGVTTRVASAGVSASFFTTLGTAPLLGRGFVAEDDVPNAAAVAVISHAAWVQYFGSDPGVIGTSLDVDTRRTIVGVMPPELDFPRGTAYWFPVVPLLAGAAKDGDALASVGVLYAVGRLRPGVSRDAAAQEIEGLASVSIAPVRFGSAVAITSFLDYVLGPVRTGLWALWAAGGLLLVIACANVSGLMLTRASALSRAHSIRVALGATRLDIGRLWLTEALLLAMAGGAIGLGASSSMVKAMLVLAPIDLPRLTNIAINSAVGLFSVCVVLLCALLCGLIAARSAASDSVVDRLKETANGAPGTLRLRGRYGLLTLQIACSVVLLVSAGLIIRSFDALRRVDVGFVSNDVVTMFVGPLSNRDMRDLLARIEARPSVQAAGAIYLRPLELGPIGQETGVRLEGQTDAASRRNPALNFQVATPGYFHATRMRLRGGRFFSDGDDAANAAVAVVGESTARRLWPGEDPIGRRLLLQEQTDWRTVVGIVGDVPYRGLGDQRLDVYEPAAQSSSTPNYVAIRTPVDAVTVATMIRTELRGIAPTAVVDSVATLDAIVARAVSPWRFASWLLAIIGLTAFLLTTVGLICIVWLEGLNRRQELAIRLALGAQRRDLLRPVLVPAAWQCATGLVIGTLVGLASARALHGLLFRVGPLDPATWLTVAAIVISVVTLATYLPARRAATVDPLTLLRQ